jgi:hypothetical protein
MAGHLFTLDGLVIDIQQNKTTLALVTTFFKVYAFE